MRGRLPRGSRRGCREVFVVLAGVLTVAAMVLCLPNAVAAVRGWSIQHTPSLGKSGSQFTSVSCPSPTSCIAVGNTSPSPTKRVTLAERWNGRRWSIQHTPSPKANPYSTLNGVWCPSKSSCTAVGSFVSGTDVTLAEHWNGSHWSIQHTPNPPGSSDLRGVSCPSSTACIAVGEFDKAGNLVTLAERWNGKDWSIQHTPNPPTARDSVLDGVSCVSASACTAVGEIDLGPQRDVSNTLIERWNGTRWSIQKTPRAPQSELNGVSCVSKAACTAVGDRASGNDTLVEHWNGHGWSIQSSPSPGKGISELDGVSCASATACTAAGFANRPGGDLVTVAERWGGGHWLIQKTPDPAGATESELGGVSCQARMVCSAVGWYRVHHNPFGTLAERHP
jgi:hypothetical protein